MGWFTRAVKELRDAGRSEPVECPRGWGAVAFQLHIEGFAPFYSFDQRCPIGGVSDCVHCRHPYNPANIGTLRESLEQLDQLRKQGLVSEAEYNARRSSIVLMQDFARPPGRGFLTTAWILGPLGMVMGGIGGWLTMAIHVAFVPIAAAGAVLLALSASFAAIGHSRRRAADSAGSSQEANW